MEYIPTLYNTLLTKSLQIPGAKVNRETYLRNNLRKYCSDEQIEIALNYSIKKAEIPKKVLDKIAKNAIKRHTLRVTGISTAAGIPGGLAMIGTIPADLVQYYYHILVVSQKLAYSYGYPQFDGDADDELIYNLTLFIGVMYGVNGANKAVIEISKRIAAETVNKLPKKALTKTVYYPLVKKIAKWIGVRLTKKTFAKNISKVIPILGGIVSGGVTYVTFYPMSNKLKRSLEEGFENYY